MSSSTIYARYPEVFATISPRQRQRINAFVGNSKVTGLSPWINRDGNIAALEPFGTVPDAVELCVITRKISVGRNDAFDGSTLQRYSL